MLERGRRIHTARDHRKVGQTGRVSRSRTVVLRYIPSANPKSRYGFVVSTAIAKRANVRNLVKRRLRAIARDAKPPQPLDIVAYATKSAPTATFTELKNDFLSALRNTSYAPPPYRRH